MTAEPDAQALAERVAQRWFPGEDAHTYAEERYDLIRLITEELQAGEWHKGSPPASVDMAGATFT